MVTSDQNLVTISFYRVALPAKFGFCFLFMPYITSLEFPHIAFLRFSAIMTLKCKTFQVEFQRLLPLYCRICKFPACVRTILPCVEGNAKSSGVVESPRGLLSLEFPIFILPLQSAIIYLRHGLWSTIVVYYGFKSPRFGEGRTYRQCVGK